MDLLRINSSKLKITLSVADCRHYGIRERDGEFDSKLVREVVSEMLEDVGAEDFSVPGEKLLVQLYPARGGGAELFVTKLSLVGERERRAIDMAENVSTYRCERAAFMFDSSDELLRAARLPVLDKKSADLYLRSDGKYMLLVEEKCIGALSDLDVLSEFGTRLQGKEGVPCPEWDKALILGCAVERLRSL